MHKQYIGIKERTDDSPGSNKGIIFTRFTKENDEPVYKSFCGKIISEQAIKHDLNLGYLEPFGDECSDKIVVFTQTLTLK